MLCGTMLGNREQCLAEVSPSNRLDTEAQFTALGWKTAAHLGAPFRGYWCVVTVFRNLKLANTSKNCIVLSVSWRVSYIVVPSIGGAL